MRQLSSIFWHTIEFGMCKENGENKFYGAGIASSYGEIDNMVQCEDIRDLEIIENPTPLKLLVQDLQPYFYRASSFEDVIQQLEDLSKSMHKPFNVTYDVATNSYEVDRAINMKDKVVAKK
jgi:phenylalanine-4-hydroxylase